MIARHPSGPGPETVPTEECPRCHHVSEENFRTRCCSRCGIVWRAPAEPEDAADFAPGGAGGVR